MPKSDQLEGSFPSLPLLNRTAGVSYTTIPHSPSGKRSADRGWRSSVRIPWPHYFFGRSWEFACRCARSLLVLSCTLVACYAARIFSVAACVDFFVHSLFRLGAFFCSFGAQRSAGRTVRLPAVLKRLHRFDCLEYYCLALLVHLAMA